jgi:hypothetical protein
MQIQISLLGKKNMKSISSQRAVCGESHTSMVGPVPHKKINNITKGHQKKLKKITKGPKNDSHCRYYEWY